MQTNSGAGDLVSGEAGVHKAFDLAASKTPRTDGLIARVMAKHPGISARAQADYYEDVHQDLAPLARQMESEIIDLVKALEGVIRVADRATDEFDAARAALAKAGA